MSINKYVLHFVQLSWTCTAFIYVVKSGENQKIKLENFAWW